MRNIVMIDRHRRYSSIYPIDKLHGDEGESWTISNFDDDGEESDYPIPLHDYMSILNNGRTGGRR